MSERMVDTFCEFCEAPITVRVADRKRGKGRFCSTSCASSKHLPTCALCDKQVREHRYKYCSAACRRTARRPVPAAERFFAKVEKRAGGCWVWVAGTFKSSGYGAFQVEGKTWTAPKWSLRYHKGEPPVAGLHCLHTCHNRLCVNPDHLYWGTHRQNMKDMVDASRQSGRLTSAQRGEIMERIEAGETNTVIARDFGVTSQAIHYYRTRKPA